MKRSSHDFTLSLLILVVVVNKMNSGNNTIGNGKKKIYIQIDWIRHGFSCSNALASLGAADVWTMLSDWEIKTHKYAKDAKLTDLGVAQAQLANKKFFNRYKGYDMICCSQLRRAMETAKELFEGIDRDIFVLPYVCEIRTIIGRVTGLNDQTIPTDWLERRAESSDKFNWLFFKTLKIDKYASASVSDFYKRLLPLIIYTIIKNGRGGSGSKMRPIKIAIVSHQKYMRKIMEIDEPIINTGVWAELLEYNMKKRAVDRSLAKRLVHKPEYIIFNGRKIVYKGSSIEGKLLDKDSIDRCNILSVVDETKMAKEKRGMRLPRR